MTHSRYIFFWQATDRPASWGEMMRRIDEKVQVIE
jgi:hypothetical protein